MVARVAHDQLVAPDNYRVRRPGRTEQRDDARVEDGQDSARVRQRVWQREVEPGADERAERSCQRTRRDERVSELAFLRIRDDRV